MTDMKLFVSTTNGQFMVIAAEDEQDARISVGEELRWNIDGDTIVVQEIETVEHGVIFSQKTS